MSQLTIPVSELAQTRLQHEIESSSPGSLRRVGEAHNVEYTQERTTMVPLAIRFRERSAAICGLPAAGRSATGTASEPFPTNHDY
jgi:hypothetical protein